MLCPVSVFSKTGLKNSSDWFKSKHIKIRVLSKLKEKLGIHTAFMGHSPNKRHLKCIYRSKDVFQKEPSTNTLKYTSLGSLWAIKFLLCHRSQGHTHTKAETTRATPGIQDALLKRVLTHLKKKKKSPNQYLLRNKPNKNKVAKCVFCSLQFNR